MESTGKPRENKAFLCFALFRPALKPLLTKPFHPLLSWLTPDGDSVTLTQALDSFTLMQRAIALTLMPR